MGTGDGPLDSLERRSATVFLVAGGLLTVFALNTASRTFLGQSYPIVQAFVAPAGLLVGVIGLLGLYPALADRTPTLAKAAGILAGITALYWTVIVVGGAGEAAGVLPALEGMVPMAFFFGVYVATLLTYAVVGIVTTYAGAHSRIVGLLVLGPAAMFLLLMARAAPNFVVDAGHALFHLGIGVILWSDGIPADRADPATDATP